MFFYFIYEKLIMNWWNDYVCLNFFFVFWFVIKIIKEELKDFFSNYGVVRDMKIIKDSEGLSKGWDL